MSKFIHKLTQQYNNVSNVYMTLSNKWIYQSTSDINQDCVILDNNNSQKLTLESIADTFDL